MTSDSLSTLCYGSRRGRLLLILHQRIYIIMYFVVADIFSVVEHKRPFEGGQIFATFLRRVRCHWFVLAAACRTVLYCTGMFGSEIYSAQIEDKRFRFV